MPLLAASEMLHHQFDQRFFPLLDVATRVEVYRGTDLWHFMHLACKMHAKPAL